VIEAVGRAPDRRRLLALQRLHHDGGLREVLSLRGGTVGAGEDDAGGIRNDEEVGLGLLVSLLERVQDRRRVLRLHHALEARIVAEHADAELQLVVTVGLERLPDLARLGQAAGDVLLGQAVGLHGREDERGEDERHHQRAREEQDLLSETQG
jgi:hypothetical protein